MYIIGFDNEAWGEVSRRRLLLGSSDFGFQDRRLFYEIYRSVNLASIEVWKTLTSLCIPDLVSLELHPCVIRKLVGEHSAEEDLRDWTAEAFVEAQLDTSVYSRSRGV